LIGTDNKAVALLYSF